MWKAPVNAYDWLIQVHFTQSKDSHMLFDLPQRTYPNTPTSMLNIAESVGNYFLVLLWLGFVGGSNTQFFELFIIYARRGMSEQISSLLRLRKSDRVSDGLLTS